MYCLFLDFLQQRFSHLTCVFHANVQWVRPGLLKLFCSVTPFQNFFLGDPLMDSLDVSDTCKHPINLQKHLYLVCQANLFRDQNYISRPQMGLQPIV